MNNLRPGWAHLNFASSRSSAINDNSPTLYPLLNIPKSSHAAHPTSQTQPVYLLGPKSVGYIRHMCPLCYIHCSAVSAKTNNPSDGHYSLTNSGKYTQTRGVGQDTITLQIFSTESLGMGDENQLHQHPNFICKIPRWEHNVLLLVGWSGRSQLIFQILKVGFTTSA